MTSDISLESTFLRFLIFLTLEIIPKGFKEDEFEEPPHPAKQTYHDLNINALCFVGLTRHISIRTFDLIISLTIMITPILRRSHHLWHY